MGGLSIIRGSIQVCRKSCRLIRCATPSSNISVCRSLAKRFQYLAAFWTTIFNEGQALENWIRLLWRNAARPRRCANHRNVQCTILVLSSAREKKRARVKDSEKPEVVDETPGTWILAVDVEVSGMSLIDNFVIEFAAVVQRVGATEPFSEFYRYLGRDPPPNKKWGQMTLRGFWLNPEKGVDGKTPFAELEERCKNLKPVPRLEAIRAFVDWARVMRMRIPVADRVIVVSDTAGFDYAWLSMLMSELKSADDDSDCNLDHLFCEYQPVCDMSSFYF